MVFRVNDVAWLASELQDARAWSELTPPVIASVWEPRTVVTFRQRQQLGPEAAGEHPLDRLGCVHGFKFLGACLPFPEWP